jgi:SAM-dependent methyltransferase
MPVDALHPGLKRLAARFGVESSAFLWQPIATRHHLRKLQQDPQYRQWIEARHGLAEHWGHEKVSDAFGLLHVGSQLYEVCRLLRQRIGDTVGKRVLDAGASDGLFLQEIGARGGVGVNFLYDCAKKIADDGQLGCMADVERLPFPDRTFDFVIC